MLSPPKGQVLVRLFLLRQVVGFCQNFPQNAFFKSSRIVPVKGQQRYQTLPNLILSFVTLHYANNDEIGISIFKHNLT